MKVWSLTIRDSDVCCDVFARNFTGLDDKWVTFVYQLSILIHDLAIDVDGGQRVTASVMCDRAVAVSVAI